MAAREDLVEQLVKLYAGDRARVVEVIRDYHERFGAFGRRDLSPGMRDMQIFCGMSKASALEKDDPYGLSLQRTEGRREWWFRVELMLSIDPDEVAAAFAKLEDEDED